MSKTLSLTAPDADRYAARTIKFTYDPCRGGHVALEVTKKEGETVERPIYGWRDGDVVDEASIEQLKNWGVRCVTRAYAGDEEIGVFPITYYMLHDTPMVRALLKKLDTDTARNFAQHINGVIGQAKSLGLVPAKFLLCADGNVRLTPIDYQNIYFVRPKA